MNEIYAFVYTDCIFESAFATMSLHKTKKGAYKAMRKFIEEEYFEWNKNRIHKGRSVVKFGAHQAWRVITMPVEE